MSRKLTVAGVGIAGVIIFGGAVVVIGIILGIALLMFLFKLGFWIGLIGLGGLFLCIAIAFGAMADL